MRNIARDIEASGKSIVASARVKIRAAGTAWSNNFRLYYDAFGGNNSLSYEKKGVELPIWDNIGYVSRGFNFIFAMPVALVGAFAINTAHNVARVTVTFTNYPLEKEDEIPRTEDKRTFANYFLGGLGYLIAIVPAALGFLGVVVGRALTNNYKSLVLVAGKMTNVPLYKHETDDAQSDEIIMSEDKRHWARKYVLGFPGLLLGTVVGAVGFASVVVGRALTNSYKSLVLVAGKMTNVPLYKHETDDAQSDEIIMSEDTRHWARKYVLGFPGLLVGAVVGAVGFAGVVVGRALTNSYKSLVLVAGKMINVPLYHESETKSDRIKMSEDKRHWARKYVLGFPGLLLGTVVGAVGFASVVVGRALTNSYKSLVLVAGKMTNVPLYKHETDDAQSDEIIMSEDTRHWARKYVLGFPGLLVGAVVGAVGFAGVVVGRALTNSYKSLVLVAGKMVNVPLYHEDENKSDRIKMSEDTRYWARKYVLGFPGLLLGTVVGVVGFAGVVVGRALTNNYKSLVLVAGKMINVPLYEDKINSDKSDKIKMSEDTRHWARKYVLSFPGLLVGAVVGAVGFAGVIVGRVLTNNWESFKLTAGKLINLSLDNNNQIPMKDDTRGLVRQFGVGIVGAAVGAVVGAVIGGVNAVRKNPGLVVLIIWNATVVGPIIVAGIRGIKEAYKKIKGSLRFSKEPVDSTHQKLKNLYASLTPMGDLPEGRKIEEAPKGDRSTYGIRKNIAKLLRKAFTFNDQSLTERTLSNILLELDKASVTVTEKEESREKLSAPIAGLSIEQKILFAVGITFGYYEEQKVPANVTDLNQLNPKTAEGKQVQAVAQFVMQYLLSSGIPAAAAANDAAVSQGPVEGTVVDPDVVPKLYNMVNGSSPSFWSTKGNTHSLSAAAASSSPTPGWGKK